MNRAKKRRVAFVVQRCGREVIGGAESLCLQIALLMSERWDVDVLTTQAMDYMTWADAYPAGEEMIDDVCVRRFPVDYPRDVEAFNALSGELLATPQPRKLEQEEAWMKAQGPMSSGLLQYIKSHADAYDGFFFFTYLYASSYYGLPLVAKKAVLVPTAHDEWPIYQGIWDPWFRQVKQFVFNTLEEKEFLAKRMGQVPAGPIAGMYVERPKDIDHAAFRTAHGIRGPFVFYLGRIDGSKNVPDLLRHYAAFRARCGPAVELVLAGPLVMELEPQDGVRYVGKISEELKWSALASCEVLLMPSQHESLSLVCLEAWAVGTPSLVNAHSGPLRGQVERSQGGLSYSDEESFCLGLEGLLAHQAAAARFGLNGSKYVARAYSRAVISDLYAQALDAALDPTAAAFR